MQIVFSSFTYVDTSFDEMHSVFFVFVEKRIKTMNERTGERRENKSCMHGQEELEARNSIFAKFGTVGVRICSFVRSEQNPTCEKKKKI